MESLFEFLNTQTFVYTSFIVNIVLIIITITNMIMLTKTNKKYLQFMKKLGNGNNLDEMLKTYLRDVREIKQDNAEIKAYYTKLDNDIASCVQKVGIVRYNAFRDVGSDLSFSIAILDSYNDGVIITGIYSRHDSTTYAKPIDKGISRYQLSEEELHVLNEAINSKN